VTNLNKTTSTNYQLAIPLIPSETSIEASKELVLNIYGTVIPGLSLDQTESKWQGNKMLFHSGGLTYDTWEIQFLVDSEYKNWMLLYNWINSVANNYDQPSARPADYQVDCSLKITDNFQNTVMKVILKNTWIQNLGVVTLSQREGEAQVECSATLVFDRLEVIEL